MPGRAEPSGSTALTAGLVILLGLLIFVGRDQLQDAPSWEEAVFWIALMLIMNLAPVLLGARSFTMDTPILLAVALLYAPAWASLLAFVGSVDMRELQGKVTLWRALFNRTQIALCVLAAGTCFHLLSPALTPWVEAAAATGAAAVGFHAINVLVVGVYACLREGVTFRVAIRDLTVGPPVPFLVVYLGYAIFALVLAYLFTEAGLLPVALLVVPLVAGREVLVRGAEARRLARQLQVRERILERLFDRISEERRDERLRIATGLHDDVLQVLVRLSQLAGFLRRDLQAEHPAARDAHEVADLTRDAISKLQHVLHDLQRSPIGTGGLVPTLTALAGDLTLESRVRIDVTALPGFSAPAGVQLVAYQAAREAIINAIKHGAPSRVRVELRREGNELEITIHDDGEGFDPNAIDTSEHFGLGLMRERVLLAGGRVEVWSVPGTGSEIRVVLPAVRSEDLFYPGNAEGRVETRPSDAVS